MSSSDDQYNWEEIQLYNTACEGLAALEKLTGEKVSMVMTITEKAAREKWNKTAKMTEAFYALPIQERLYSSGMSKRPEGETNE